MCQQSSYREENLLVQEIYNRQFIIKNINKHTKFKAQHISSPSRPN